MRQMALRREKELINKALDWGSPDKSRKEALEKLEKEEGLRFPRWTKHFVSGFFGVVALGGLSVGAVKIIPRFMVKPTPTYAYEQFEEDRKEESINRTVEHAKLIGTDDKKLSIDELHKKYTYTFNEQGDVVPWMPDDYKTLVFLFGDSVGSSVMAWSNYFGIDPAIVVAILCAENGSSADPYILNTVGAAFMKNPHLADQTVSRSGAKGIAQIKPSTAKLTIRKLVREGRWPFETTNADRVLSDYDMSIFLLCALIQEIKTLGYTNIRDIAGIYHSGHNGWGRKKANGENDDEVWKQIKKAERAEQQYKGIRAYLSESIQN